MSIYVKCEGCGKVLSVPGGSEGRAIQCAHCGKKLCVPEQPPQTRAEAATPPPAAPVNGGMPEDQGGFLRALAEKAAREQREADTAKTAGTGAKAGTAPSPGATAGDESAAIEELVITPGAGESGYAAAKTPEPPAPAAPSSPAPASGGISADKDAFFKALVAEAARDQGEAAAAKGAGTGAEAGTAPSPEALVRGRSAAATELRVKTVADKSGYSIAESSTPEPPAGHDRRRRSRKLIGAAAGLLLLIVIILSIVAGLSSKKPRANERPVATIPAIPSTPVALAPAVALPELPTALKEAAQALAAKTLVEVEVAEASADAAEQRIPLLTPTGDLMVDVTNLHIRDKSDADAGIQEMRSASRSAVYESAAAKLREKGLTPVEAGGSAAAKPGEIYSRLKVVISTTPAWAGFSFRERGNSPSANNDNMPSRPVQPQQPRPSLCSIHRVQRALSRGPAIMALSSVKLWDRLVNGGQMISVRFGPIAAATWLAIPTDDAQADLLPCGLRLSIVQVAWEVGGRTHDLIGRSAEANPARSANDVETGAAVPFRRPKQLREIQLTGQIGSDRICLVSGFCQYDDVNLDGNAAEAGKLAAGLLAAPDADWSTLWDGKADNGTIAASCRNILRLDGGPAIAGVLTAKPDRLPRSSADVLASVLKEAHSSPEWAGPFLAVRGPCSDAALICLARQPKEENEKDFLQWVAAPADHSPESVQAACCALIDLGRPGPQVNALIDTDAVKAFSEVRSPRGSLAFPPQTAQTVLNWLIRNGTGSQRIGAAAAVTEGNINELHDQVRSFVNQSLESDPETLYSLCKGIENTKSPLAFEILSSVAQHRLMQSDAGDRFLPPAAFADAGGPLSAGRYSRTVAALVCAGLARFDKFEAGKVLVGLMQSPGPATRYCAIETLIALDDVDASKEIRARFDFLGKRARNEYEAQEWELLTPAKNRLCRYDVPLIIAENALKNGIRTKEVIETCDGIIKENPSPALVERARAMKRQAEKALESKPGTPH